MVSGTWVFWSIYENTLTGMESFEPLPHFVDDYLGFLYETRPTAATFDGVHTHDDLLEDFSRPAIDRQMRDLGGFARRLSAIRVESLTAEHRLDHAMLDADIRARLLELEQTRNFERNPQLYADTLATSLAPQVLFNYAAPHERGRRIVSKLRQVPSFLQSARANLKEPPGLFVKTALETFRGLLTFLDQDLPRALAAVDDLSLLGDLADASTEASRAIAEFVTYLERDVAPKSRSSFRLGDKLFAQKLHLDEGIGLPLDRLLDIAQRELDSTQEEFRTLASKMGGKEKDPLVNWRKLKETHPPAGQLVTQASTQVEQLLTFLTRQKIVSVPEHEPLRVAPTPPFYRWTFASIWSPGPFETKALRAYYYLTDVDPAWPADRQKQHLLDFNEPTLWAISMHEAYPGHHLHFQHLRRIESRLRKSTVLMPLSVVEGWAHYAEHLIPEAGFQNGDHSIKLGQLAESLVRLARLFVAVRLHADDWSVEQGVRFFRDEAFLEEPSARREAERGTFDPSYGVYAVGKLALMKLRADYQAEQGKNFSLRQFHDDLLGQGGLPLPLQRKALLKDSSGPVIE